MLNPNIGDLRLAQALRLPHHAELRLDQRPEILDIVIAYFQFRAEIAVGGPMRHELLDGGNSPNPAHDVAAIFHRIGGRSVWNVFANLVSDAIEAVRASGLDVAFIGDANRNIRLKLDPAPLRCLGSPKRGT